MIILDTNVLSEVMKAAPAGGVTSWLEAQPRASLCTTQVTEAEIRYGVELLPSGERRRALGRAVDLLFRRELAGRVLPFDGEAAAAYGVIMAERRRIGRPMSQLDGQIAAIARSRNAVVATRNVADFEHCGIQVLDPWQGRSP